MMMRKSVQVLADERTQRGLPGYGPLNAGRVTGCLVQTSKARFRLEPTTARSGWGAALRV
jgi:hypothetical protein